ncbi:STM4011 family radical SAM protein [Chitinophaga rhizophila]|uniref:STM4011 family radical SAM protein n=1 Tax=Chitinophaga rhizophila TaxID=2866212 RepID=A0ABS7G690_9BACT|nr:STM4011 family radical SAM protein [Chitinophaga rhizophila]MBW8683172.1 STM4011 family radical SAM protein [Chitinophaga rhizophila]
MTLSILYRGPLSSCNYSCNYCPFAKRKDSRETLERDAAQLKRFITFVSEQAGIQFKILFTPWGEALIRRYYQEAMVTLSLLPNVEKVAIQTNLSCRLEWLNKADKSKLALWTTYHPGETDRATFLSQCRQLDELQVSYSVGVVGFKEVIPEIETLRAALPAETYLWVNALKKQADYYTAEETATLSAIDPYVVNNMIHYDSFGKNCKTGHSVISLDGDGNMYRCHFIKEKIGNIYTGDFTSALYPRTCTNATCGCHIGYVHMDDLNLYELYKGRELERIVPDRKPLSC